MTPKEDDETRDITPRARRTSPPNQAVAKGLRESLAFSSDDPTGVYETKAIDAVQAYTARVVAQQRDKCAVECAESFRAFEAKIATLKTLSAERDATIETLKMEIKRLRAERARSGR